MTEPETIAFASLNPTNLDHLSNESGNILKIYVTVFLELCNRTAFSSRKKWISGFRRASENCSLFNTFIQII